MQLIRGLRSLKPEQQKCVITIGNFDGVHKGHKKLLHRLKIKAKEYQTKSMLIIFKPHPKEFFQDYNYRSINSFIDKLKLIEKENVDFVLYIDFNQEMADYPPRDFITEIIKDKIKAQYVLTGDDFKFGKNKAGDYKLIKQLTKQCEFEAESHESVYCGADRVSSSLIKKLLIQGSRENIKRANSLLGYELTITGKVFKGKKLGKSISFPTANIKSSNKRLCFAGVYLVKVTIETENYYGITNMGFQPTVNGKDFLIETHIFDFNKNIYGNRITVQPIEKIRDEIKFSSIKELKEQIQKDTLIAKKITREIKTKLFGKNTNE